ncbi:MAG: dephospho-CoA kinase [Proteobacteria bacterium]|nr:dephospho-CoA kinase [Pseudomonadota bacterium]
MESKKTITVAVTGGAASGKSAVCKCLGKKGLPVINLDAIAREVVLPGTPAHGKIVEVFGKGVLLSNGTLDRAALRNMITRDPQGKKNLESVVQPEILRVMQERIKASKDLGPGAIVVEIPLLFELSMEKDFDISLLVVVDKDVQIRRLMDRDGVSEDAALSLINIQMPFDEKIKRADIIIENNGSYENLCCSTDKVFEKYLS